MAGLTLDETARALGHVVWLEEQCFELLGRWGPASTERDEPDRDEPDPETTLLLARLSRGHGERARALAELLPDTRDHHPDASVAPAAEPWRTRLAEAATTAPPDRRGVAAALTAAVLADEERILAAAGPVGDEPLRRRLSWAVVGGRQDLDELGRKPAEGGSGRR